VNQEHGLVTCPSDRRGIVAISVLVPRSATDGTRPTTGERHEVHAAMRCGKTFSGSSNRPSTKLLPEHAAARVHFALHVTSRCM
jgi:hypothetical protein